MAAASFNFQSGPPASSKNIRWLQLQQLSPRADHRYCAEPDGADRLHLTQPHSTQEQCDHDHHINRQEIKPVPPLRARCRGSSTDCTRSRSEEHTSELQSHHDLVCRLL